MLAREHGPLVVVAMSRYTYIHPRGTLSIQPRPSGADGDGGWVRLRERSAAGRLQGLGDVHRSRRRLPNPKITRVASIARPWGCIVCTPSPQNRPNQGRPLLVSIPPLRCCCTPDVASRAAWRSPLRCVAPLPWFHLSRLDTESLTKFCERNTESIHWLW